MSEPEVREAYRALSESAPGWTTLETVGETREGRPIQVLTIGDQNGDPASRPAFWIDAGTHAAEWTGVMTALYSATTWVEALLEGDDALVHWFKTHTVYIVPNLSPDGFAAMREGAPFLRSTMRPPRDGRPRVGLDPSDLDGDGAVRWMRWRHPTGTWIFDDPNNSAKMRWRTLDDDPAEAFHVASEGTFLSWDGVSWTSAGWAHGLDLNRNFPVAWAPFEMFGMDGGDYPLSEPESRAAVESFRARPRIAAAITHHTYTGCLLTPPYRDPSPLPTTDVDLMNELAMEAAEGTGYRVYKVVPDFVYDKNQSIVGVWADAMAATFGVPGYTLELWDPYAFAGREVDKPAELFKRPDLDLLHAVLDAFLDEPGAIVPWKAFDHPQLGPVELGGIAYQTTVRNPPPRLLAEECKRGHTVTDRLRRALPRVEVELSVHRVGDDTSRVELVVENLGYLATGGLKHAQGIGVAPPIVASLALSDGLSLEDGAEAQNLGWLEGWGSLRAAGHNHPIYPGLPVTGGVRTRAVWWVKGAGEVRVEWDAGRAGAGHVGSAIA